MDFRALRGFLREELHRKLGVFHKVEKNVFSYWTRKKTFDIIRVTERRGDVYECFGITSELTLYILLTAAVVSDLQTAKISNRLIEAGLLLAIGFRFLSGGWIQIVRCLPNIIFPVVILYLFYVCGAIGAGDIKLFSMIGGFFSFRELWTSMLCSFIAGAVLSLVYMLYFGTLKSGLVDSFIYFGGLLRGNVRVYERKGGYNKIHFTIAIVIGIVAARLVMLWE